MAHRSCSVPPHELALSEPVQSSVLTGLTLTDSFYAPGYREARHAHSRACLHAILSGGYTETTAAKTRDMVTPAVVYQPAGYDHSFQIHAMGSRGFTVELPEEWLRRLPGPAAGSPAAVAGGLPGWLMRRLYHEFRQPDAAAPLIIEGLALELLAELTRPPVRPPERAAPAWLTQARDLLHDRFAEKLSLAEIAAGVGAHPTHLARAFRRQYGCSVGEYGRQLRVEFARRQLAVSDRCLAELALEAGFADQAHLTRTFKRLTGMTPSEYRRQRQPR